MSDNGGLNRDASGDPSLAELSETLEGWFGVPLPIRMLEFIRTNALEGGSDNSPLRYGKTSVYEGGARVPSFVHWPERLKSSSIEAFITVQDVLPTILSAVGASVPEDLDGGDQFKALTGKAAGKPKDYVTLGQFGDQAYYQWPWKLISGEDVTELYHLENDPTEARNVAAQHPERVVAMQKLLADLPRSPSLHIPLYRVFLDPDFFGGEEDRGPWADLTIRE